MTLYSFFKGHGLREAIAREYDKTPTDADYEKAAQGAKLVIVRPSKAIPAQLITFSAKPLQETFLTGYQDIFRHGMLREIAKEHGLNS